VEKVLFSVHCILIREAKQKHHSLILPLQSLCILVPTNLDTYQLSSKNFFLCSLLPFTAQATSNKLQERITCIWNLGSLSSAQSAAAMMGVSNNPWIECFIKGEWIFEKLSLLTLYTRAVKARYCESCEVKPVEMGATTIWSCISGQGRLLWKRSSQIDMNDMS